MSYFTNAEKDSMQQNLKCFFLIFFQVYVDYFLIVFQVNESPMVLLSSDWH